MKIIEDDNSWTCARKCHTCEVDLEINELDLGYDSFKVSGTFYGGDAICKPFFYFNCMVCHSDNTIKDEDVLKTIPNAIRARLIKKFKDSRR